MSRATPQMRDFAERLIAHETRGNKSSETKTPAAFHVCEKLRPHLATLMGNAVFGRSFRARSRWPMRKFPGCARCMSKRMALWKGWTNLTRKLARRRLSEGSVVLLAQLLGLLVAFIGEDLTLRLVREVWPKLSLDDLDFGKGDKNEKAK